MFPFFYKDMNARLLIEPIIPGLPSLTRVHETKTKKMNDLGDHFVDLTQRNLPHPMVSPIHHSQSRRKAKERTHIFPDARSSTGAKHQHRSLHPRIVPLKPSLWPEDLGVRSEHIRIVLHDCAVDSHAIPLGEKEPGNGRTAGGDDAWHREADAWVETHAFVNACFKVAECDGLSVRDRKGEGAFGNGGVNF